MDYYFVAKEKKGKLIGHLTAQQIVERFRTGNLFGHYVATKSTDVTYSELVESLSVPWVTGAQLVATLSNDAGNQSEPRPLQEVLTAEAAAEKANPPFSASATGALRMIAFAVAIVGIIGGVKVLTNSPSAPSDIAVRFGNDLPTQIEANRMMYLIVGWSQIIGGITTGIFLYVVAGIGDAVLDLWAARHTNDETASSKTATSGD